MPKCRIKDCVKRRCFADVSSRQYKEGRVEVAMFIDQIFLHTMTEIIQYLHEGQSEVKRIEE